MREKKDKHFLNKPIYEGGPKAMQQFIRENLKYPKEALKNKVEGVVVVRYTIDKDGKVIKTSVKTGLGHGCDEEAQRVVRLLKFHVQKNRKVKAIFHKSINIRFKLPKRQSRKLQMEISYRETKEPKENSAEKGYGYTIEI